MFPGSASRTVACVALYALLSVCTAVFATPVSAQNTAVQPGPTQAATLLSAHRVERLGGVPLAGEWKFRLGDNPSWSLPTFDDTGWATLIPGAPLPDTLRARIDSLKAAGRPAVGWFRLRLMPERALLRKPLALAYDPNGASVVYLDSRKILELGDFSATTDAYADARAPLLPGAVVFDDTPALLAVRFHLGSWDALQAGAGAPLFSATVLPREAIAATAEQRRFDGGVMLGLFGLFAALGMLHLVLHALMRRPASTLHYSLFALLFSLCPLLVYVIAGTESLRLASHLGRAFWITQTFSMLALLTFLYSFFQSRLPRHYWAAVIVAAVLALALMLPLAGMTQAAAVLVFVLIAIEGTRIIWLALRRGTAGARVVGAGFLTTFALLLYGVIAAQFGLSTPRNLAWYAWLGIALASAVQIAQSFASASKASERLSRELSDVNRSLETKVQQRTLELEARAESERRNATEQKALLDTMSELSGELELDRLLQSVLDRAVTLLDAAGGELAIYDETTDELQVVANKAMTSSSIGARLRVGEGAMGHVVATQQQMNIPDYEAWEGRSTQYATIKARAVVVSPLLIGSRPVGAINVWHEETGRQFGEGDLRLINSFAQQAAIAIQSARLYTDAQQQRQFFEAVVVNSPVAIVTLDLEQNIANCNPAFERLYGWSIEEIAGRNLDELISDETTRAEAEQYTKAAEAGTIHHMGRRRRRDGSYVEVEVAAVPVVVEGTRVGLLALYHDVTELLRARKEAEAADQAKSQFLANMSHELRTPLNAIIGYSEMMIEEAEDSGDEVYAPDLRKIHSSGRHLLGLINDILDLSKIEAGRMELYVESFSIQPVLEEVATTVQTLVERNGNTLALDIEPGIGIMRSDQVKVRQILFNLLSNACKFTENGTITLAARRTDPYITFTVSDTGIGMTADQRERLFQPFMQADASTTKKYGGTGLGLAITKHFCEMMGGAVDLSSDPGKGTTFIVRILAEVTPPEAAEIRRADVPQADNAATVLVIDDDPSTRDVISRTLAKDGYRVVVASGGEEGLRLARVEHPDVITLDVLMAGMDGWAVLTRLKADPVTADIPVIVMTIVDDRNLGFALGAADYLTKPVDRERLTDVLQRVRADGRHGPVLVVEDDTGTREMLRRILEKDNWRVVEAENGRVALDRMLDSTPALVLLDLMMPEMDGFTFVEELRTRGVASTVPIVVLTAKTLSARDRERLEGSVSRVLQKGADSMSEVVAEVRRVVAARPAAPATS